MHSGATKVLAVLAASTVLRCESSYNRDLKKHRRDAA